MKLKIYSVIIFSTLLNYQSFAQNLTFFNPSFEGDPAIGAVPAPWKVCFGTPDTQPGNFQVMLPASDGDTYLGFVTTTGNNEEGASQKLSSPMIVGQAYTFTCDLAYAAGYSGWTAPAKLIIYGGNVQCDTKEILYVSDYITDLDWKQHTITFIPGFAHKYITFSSWGDGVPKAANILIDNLSPVIPKTDLSVFATVDKNLICQKKCVQLSGSYSGGAGEPFTIQWTSIPAGYFSDQLNPSIVCPMETTKYILKVKDKNNNSVTDTIMVNVKPLPVAIFDYDKLASNVFFYGTDNNGVNYWEWDFGDRSEISFEQNPEHIYLQHEKFIVQLVVRNDCGPDTALFEMNIDGSDGSGSNVGLAKLKQNKKSISIFPNPIQNEFVLYNKNIEINYETVRIMDISGKVIWVSKFQSNPQSFIIPEFTKGMYFINLIGKNNYMFDKIFID